MFHLAIITGIYSYVVFTLGLLSLLYREVVIGITVLFLIVCVLIFRKRIIRLQHTLRELVHENKKKKLFVLLSCILLLQILVNGVGAFGPELAFDALWYHLTLPKIYLEHHSLFYIPGGLLYYSAMPKLGEMLFVGAMGFGNEINAKVLHLLFGILSSIALYKLSRTFLTPVLSLTAVIIFYSNLVVAWESTTAYIDLIRTFFEVMAVWGLILWWRTKRVTWFFITAIMLGLAITTKLLAIGSLLIIASLIIYKLYKETNDIKESVIWVLQFLCTALAVPLPWFLFSFIHTGNPVYPFFTSTYTVDPSTPNPLSFFADVWNILLFSPDPISPIYMIFIPLIVLVFRNLKGEEKVLIIYSLLSLLMWYFTPRTGGGRFLMSYLPIFSLVCAIVLNYYLEHKKKFTSLLYKWLFVIIILVACTTVLYRGVANWKYVQVLSGMQSKETFLAENLNFQFGDFYDIDGYFSKTMEEGDTVLLYGFHNLYYIQFPYIHSSWAKEGDTFTYIATQDAELPQRFSTWQLVYKNAKTNINVYTDGGKVWKY
jgi:hypothetical protein